MGQFLHFDFSFGSVFALSKNLSIHLQDLLGIEILSGQFIYIFLSCPVSSYAAPNKKFAFIRLIAL